jgi:hypothetical protein
MDENRARRVTDALRDRGIAAHLRKSGIDAYSVQVPAGQGREAIWGAEGTTGLEAEVLLDGDLVGFVPQIPGSENFDEAQIVDAIARADYDQPVGRERDQAPPPGKPLAHEGGLFRRFIDGFRYDSEALSMYPIMRFALFKNPPPASPSPFSAAGHLHRPLAQAQKACAR